jgi:hypothetical protein
MSIESDSDFLTGVLGYTSPAEHRQFDEENWSWITAWPSQVTAARSDTISPFSVDLRDRNRWVAFAPTARLTKKMFAEGFERVLNSAINAAGLIPTEWEVDMVVSRNSVDEWLREHPLVYQLRRTVKFPNPGRDLDADRQEMRALGARRKTEEYAASSRGVINTSADQFNDKLDGVETGDIELILRARGRDGSGDAIFNSSSRADEVSVDSFGGDLRRGIVLVGVALRQYVSDLVRSLGLDEIDANVAARFNSHRAMPVKGTSVFSWQSRS